MKRYLKTISSTEAKRLIMERVQFEADEEDILVHESLHRVTAKPVFANVSNPPFLCSAMDGFAVLHEQTLGADLSNPVMLGRNTDAFAVNTGDILPHGADAVIMVEDTEVSGDVITIRKPVYLWQNTRMVGEDVIEKDMLLPVNHIITAFDMGMIISSGIARVTVRKRPKVLIIPTGKELIDIFKTPHADLTAGLIDFNSYTLRALAAEAGCDPVISEIITTRDDLLKSVKSGSAEYDVIIINAGSSAGTEDFTGSVIGQAGEIVFHGVSMMPGKPLLFGTVGKTPVFGIPGYPVSAVLTFMRFVRPVCEKLLGVAFHVREVPCAAAYKIPSRIGIEEIIRVNLISNRGKYHAIPLPRGASAFSSMARADGLICIPEHKEGLSEGEEISCELLRDEAEIKRCIHIIGSHDLSLDVARDIIKGDHPDTDLVSTHTGSLSGILAVRSGVAGLATTHILDEDGVTYNIPMVRKYLSGITLKLIHIARRQQGIFVRRGNPLSIRGIADLARSGVRFVNRQFGSGTRILFDQLLNAEGIEKGSITGYDREESSHTAVGILVRESIADAGIGIYSVAQAFSLDFIPLAEEDYDLIVSGDVMDDPRYPMLMDTIMSGEFSRRLKNMGGYNTSQTGTVKYSITGQEKQL